MPPDTEALGRIQFKRRPEWPAKGGGIPKSYYVEGRHPQDEPWVPVDVVEDFPQDAARDRDRRSPLTAGLSRAGHEIVGADRRRESIGGITHVAHTWMTRCCADCGEWKPLFTAYCDECAKGHGLTE